MQKINIFILCALLIVLSACHGGQVKGTVGSDSLITDDNLPLLVGDSCMNKAAQFYAGLNKENISMNNADEQAWNKYKAEMDFMMNNVHSTLYQVDSIMKVDMKDLRDDIDFVFYPFSGADFLYPITLFPEADTYFLLGLEKPGNTLGEIKTSFAQYESYRRALSFYLQYGYFITKNMITDLGNENLNGVLPIISMLMATENFEIQNIRYITLGSDGSIQDSTENSNMVEIKFFRKDSYHLQTLYFLSGNLMDASYSPLLEKYQEEVMSKQTVVTYLKAASYLMHLDMFSKIRNNILKYSHAVIQDDSGIPVRFFADDWNIDLYGTYIRPLPLFGRYVFQYDLMELYNKKEVHKLPFRIGYNYPSNLLCARKKQENHSASN